MVDKLCVTDTGLRKGGAFFVIGDSLLTERKTFDLYYEDFDLLGCKEVENAAKRKGKFGKEVLRSGWTGLNRRQRANKSMKVGPSFSNAELKQ